MQPIRVGLMGFGRIGRNLFRLLYQREDVMIVAIGDRAARLHNGVWPAAMFTHNLEQ